jgi:hypothetical protein
VPEGCLPSTFVIIARKRQPARQENLLTRIRRTHSSRSSEPRPCGSSKISVGEETATVLLAIVKFTLHKEPLRLDEHALMFGYKVSVVSNVWKYGRGDRAFVPHAVE